MERPAGVPRKPLAHLWMLVGRIIVDDGVDQLRKPLNASQEIIRITEITKMEWGDQLSPEGWRASPNGVGGLVIHVMPVKTWAKGDYLYLHFTVVAKAPWRGHLSFEGRSDRRLYVRVSFSILQDAFTGSILSSS